MHCLQSRNYDNNQFLTFEKPVVRSAKSHLKTLEKTFETHRTTDIASEKAPIFSLNLSPAMEEGNNGKRWVMPFKKPSATDSFYASLNAFKTAHDLNITALGLLFWVSRQSVYDWLNQVPGTIQQKHQSRMRLLQALFGCEEAAPFPLNQWLRKRDDPDYQELISLFSSDETDEAALWRWRSKIAYRTQRLAKLAAIEKDAQSVPRHWLVDPSNSGV